MVETMLPFDPPPGLWMFMTKFFTESLSVMPTMLTMLSDPSHRSLVVAALLVLNQRSMALTIVCPKTWDGMRFV